MILFLLYVGLKEHIVQTQCIDNSVTLYGYLIKNLMKMNKV